MKRILTSILALAVLLTAIPPTHAADAKAELQALIEKVKTKLQAGQKGEAALAPELAEFDTLLAAHQGEKTDDVGNILFMKALLYAQVLENDEKATSLLKQVQADYPDTDSAKNADKVMASIAAQAAAHKIKAGLKEGAVFPPFDEKDLDGKPLSIASHKGKVVMIDFWATWCGPCVGELPNVLKAYEKYHGKGFEIIGISLDQDHDKLTAFLKEKNVTWAQYFDGQGWQNKLAQQYGVNSIPATYLLDGEGKIIARDLRGEALETELAKVLK